jgi:hypothetical protein
MFVKQIMSFKTRLEGTQGKKLQKYGVFWSTMAHPLWIEMQVVAAGGQWKKKNGETAGEGSFFHYKEAIRLLWPHFEQHRWFDLFLDNWLKHKYIAVMGPKSSGKTADAAICHLMDYYCFSTCTTVIVCSDTMENLEDRIWGEIKKLHRSAKEQHSWIPGQLIEGRLRLVTDKRDESTEGRDFRNGMVGIPVKKGSAVVGLSSFVGRKNKRVRICGDELSLLNKTFIDAIASQANQDVKITGMGNPSQTTDALGLLAEPHTDLGGWDGGIDQTPKTKTWKTRWPDGVCIQFPGADCPNMDVPEGDPVPFPFLITRKHMEDDAKIWGRDDWRFAMFNLGMMPRGQGSRRVITRQLCVKHGALKDPIWKNTIRTKIACLDAAYRSVGGDRCVFITLEFGEEGIVENSALDPLQVLIDQSQPVNNKRQIISLINLSIIPIKSSDFDSPEDQIVMFTKMQCESQAIPPRNFFFDSGMRTSLVTAFSRLWSVDVNSIDCGGRPSERPVSEQIDVKACDYYSKKITELWYSVRMVIEAGQFRGMTEDVMIEGCYREWKTVGANKIEVETKSEMKEKSGRSPDLFDCLAIGVEGARQRGFGIRRLANKDSVYDDGKWKGELKRKALSMVTSKQLNYSA